MKFTLCECENKYYMITGNIPKEKFLNPKFARHMVCQLLLEIDLWRNAMTHLTLYGAADGTKQMNFTENSSILLASPVPKSNYPKRGPKSSVSQCKT